MLADQPGEIVSGLDGEPHVYFDSVNFEWHM